jgi:hypothetical protein
MLQVFISYSREDVSFAEQLVQDISQQDIAVWFDQTSIQPGENWDAAIEAGLRESDAVLVIISPASMASDNVRNEVNFAREAGQLIIPVLYQPAPIFLNLQSIQWVDLSTDTLYQHNLPILLAHLQRDDWDMLGTASTLSGVQAEAAQGELLVVNDTRLCDSSDLTDYLRVLAIIAGPFADSSGENTPAQRLNPNAEWRNLAAAINDAAQIYEEDGTRPIALTRLLPPTTSKLESIFNEGGHHHIMHLVGYTIEGQLVLENETGRQNPIPTNVLLDLLEQSQAQMLILQGEIPSDLAAKISENRSLRALVHTGTSLPGDAARLFNSRLYGHLSAGMTVQEAFDEATNYLNQSHPAIAAECHLYLAEDAQSFAFSTPPGDRVQQQSLIDAGLSPLVNVPVNIGFIGQREALNAIQRQLHSANVRQMAIYGLSGIGKSWLAAEYVMRFGWRYPDGILWMHISEQTKSEDIIGQVMALLELPADTRMAEVWAHLRRRHMLIVLDQANEWLDPLEVGELTDFIARIDPASGTRILLTSWGPVEPLTHISGTRDYTLEEMSPEDARLLMQQMVRRYGLEEEFANEAAVDEFLEKTLFTPWLILEGMRLVRLSGLETALVDLADIADDIFDTFTSHIGAQINRLEDGESGPRHFLRQLQGLPAGFERELALHIGGESARDHLRTLLHHRLLRREGNLFYLPATVRVYLRQVMPLNEAEHSAIDEAIIRHLLNKPAAATA